jgi:hypothetical protein
MTICQSTVLYSPNALLYAHLRDFNHTYLRLLTLVSQPIQALCISFQSFFCLWLILDTFYSYVFIFANLFFCGV